jgi:hypothetical protein
MLNTVLIQLVIVNLYIKNFICYKKTLLFEVLKFKITFYVNNK